MTEELKTAPAPVKAAAKKKAPVKAASAKKDARDAEIAALKAKLAAGEEAALARVCKAMDLDPKDVEKKEAEKPKDQPMVRCFVHYPVRINDRVYSGHVTVPYDTFGVIQQALGDRRQRLLRELTGNNYILRELETGGYAPKLVGTVGMEPGGA